MPATPRPGQRFRRRTSPPGSPACPAMAGGAAHRRSAPPPIMRITCSSSGRMAPSTNSGGSPASMPKVITTVTPMCRRYICRAGTTLMPARQWRTTRASRAKRRPAQLILGSWTHGDRSLGYAGDVDFGPAAAADGNLAEDFFDLRRRWFDRWVKDLDNGIDREPAVRVFVMGGGSGRKTSAGRLDHGGAWRDGADWPFPGTQWTRFYLQPDRSLGTTVPGDGAAPLALM